VSVTNLVHGRFISGGTCLRLAQRLICLHLLLNQSYRRVVRVYRAVFFYYESWRTEPLATPLAVYLTVWGV